MQLENGAPQEPTLNAYRPHATHLPLPHRHDIAATIWMGGTNSLLGSPMHLADIGRAIIVDCAGELSDAYRRGAGAYVPRVIMDSESRPFALHRLESLALDLAQAINGDSVEGYPDPPERIYVLCQYGMNRSGLVTGLLLRALGEEPDEIVNLIRRLRPGALSNRIFERLIREWAPPLLSA